MVNIQLAKDFLLMGIKNETEKIIGSNSLGCEYSGLFNLIFSINKTRVAIARAFIGVGKPVKYAGFSLVVFVLNRARRMAPIIKGAQAISSPEIPGIFWV